MNDPSLNLAPSELLGGMLSLCAAGLGLLGLATGCFLAYAVGYVCAYALLGDSASALLYGLLALCAALLLRPWMRALLDTRPPRRAALDLEAADASRLSPLRRAWLRETRWLLLCLREAEEQEVMQQIWEFLARARSLGDAERLELHRAGVEPRLVNLRAALRRNGERLRWRARRQLWRQLDAELHAIERGLLTTVSVDPYR